MILKSVLKQKRYKISGATSKFVFWLVDSRNKKVSVFRADQFYIISILRKEVSRLWWCLCYQQTTHGNEGIVVK